jgi:uncharacterized membrane protein
MPFYCLLLPVIAALIWAALRQRGQMRELERKLEALRLEWKQASGAPRAQAPVAQPPSAMESAAPPIPAIPAPPIAEPASAAPEDSGWSSAEPAAAPAQPPARPRTVEWERWIGVRGAAVAGGVVLALAAILFFKHAFTHGWVSPSTRVGTGVLAGFACLVVAARLRRREFDFAPSALEGAGIVTLYAAAWYARLASLIGATVVFPCLAAITVLALSLSLVRRSQLTAILALAGGFATPLLLGSSEDRPIGLFGYILLLDLGLMFAGRRQAWPWLTLAALLGTACYEALWIFSRMGEHRGPLGLGILAVFALLFLVAGTTFLAAHRRSGRASQALAIAFPLLFAVHFAANVDFGGRLAPLAGFVAMLAAAACWIARRNREPHLALGAAAGALGVVGAWFVREAPLDPRQSWELSLGCLALAALFHASAEMDRHAERGAERGPPSRVEQAAFLFAIGSLALLGALTAANQSASDPFWPWAAGSAGLAALLLRLGVLFEWKLPPMAAGLGLGLGLLGYLGFNLGWTDAPRTDSSVVFNLAALAGLSLVVLGWSLRGRVAGRATLAGAVLFCSMATYALRQQASAQVEPQALLLWRALAFGVLSCAAATILASSAAYALAAFATLLGQLCCMLDSAIPAGWRGLLPISVGGAAMWLWPAMFAKAWKQRAWAWRAAIAAALAWYAFAQWVFPELRTAWVYGSLAALGAFFVHGLWGDDPIPAAPATTRSRATVRYAAAALCWLCLALAWRIDHGVLAVTGALSALALCALSRRFSDPVPLGFAAALGTICTLVIGVTALLPGYYASAPSHLLNWLSYVHLTSAAALLVASRLIAPSTTGHPFTLLRPLPSLLALCGLSAIFFWLNLEILNYFTKETTLTFRLERLPARDVATSIAWLLYSLTLLGFGMARRSSGLRWASLGLLLLTLGKVFLYDIGEVEGLYRVASLLGLALSLILVSLLYQRFVFRRLPTPSL